MPDVAPGQDYVERSAIPSLAGLVSAAWMQEVARPTTSPTRSSASAPTPAACSTRSRPRGRAACGGSPSPAPSSPACSATYKYLDTTRLREDTGFRPQYDVERAEPDYVDWLRGHDR